MPRRIHVEIDIEDAPPEMERLAHTADGYQAASDWLLGELGSGVGTAPPVEDEAALIELVEIINDKFGTRNVQVRWEYRD